MRRLTFWMAAAALAALASAALAAYSGAPTPSRTGVPTARPVPPVHEPPKETTTLSGDYARMADELGMKAPQRRRLAQAVEAKAKALEVWDKQNGKRLADLQQTLAKAKADKKESLVGRLEPQVAAMEQARARVEAAGEARIMAVLTVEQRAAWEGRKLAKEVLDRFRSIRLDADQTAKVEALSKEAAKSLKVVVTAEDLKAAADQLVPVVTERVLTAEQRAQLEKSKPKPPVAPAPAPARPPRMGGSSPAKAAPTPEPRMPTVPRVPGQEIPSVPPGLPFGP